MRIIFLFCIGLLLLGCGEVAYQPEVIFEIGDEAPVFQDIDWLEGKTENLESLKPEKEFNLDDLKGQVVLLNFWSYDCGFCREVVGWLNEWDDQYRDQGLEIIGIHTPDFAYERKRKNVERLVKELEIKYLVGLDNKKTTWKAYHNKYRPATYLIDREGKLQFLRYGTGYREETEAEIRRLLEITE